MLTDAHLAIKISVSSDKKGALCILGHIYFILNIMLYFCILFMGNVLVKLSQVSLGLQKILTILLTPNKFIIKNKLNDLSNDTN